MSGRLDEDVDDEDDGRCICDDDLLLLETPPLVGPFVFVVDF